MNSQVPQTPPNPVELFRFQRYQNMLSQLRAISVELTIDPGILTDGASPEIISDKLTYFTAELGKLLGVCDQIAGKAENTDE